MDVPLEPATLPVLWITVEVALGAVVLVGPLAVLAGYVLAGAITARS